MARTTTEPPVTTEELRRRLGEIQETVCARAREKVLGVPALTLGGVVLGVGALGLAYWLGRRSARAAETASPAGESGDGAPAPCGDDGAAALSPLVSTVVRTVVDAVSRRLSP